MSSRPWIVWWLVATCSLACAKSQSLPGSATPPKGPAEELQDTPESPAEGGYGYETGDSYEPKPAPSSLDSPAPQDKIARLIEDLSVAESMVLSSGGDCVSACRALRSMERATARLCALASTDDEVSRCRSAEGRVRSARKRVREVCGYCAGGPPLSPDE